MKLFLLLFFPVIAFGQKNCEGTVVDKTTGKAIPYATIGLVRENKGVSANEQGAFNITASFPKTDSLRVSSVGYQTLVLPVSEWADGKVVALRQNVSVLREVVVSNRTRQTYTLNRFGHCSWNWYWIGWQTIYQRAQKFEALLQQMQLTEVELCKDKEESVFRIRVYDIDSTNHSPTKDLADTVIEIRSSESHVRIDLEKYDIIIPGKTFFIAIEWLFIPSNEYRIKEKNNGRKTTHTYYKPAMRWEKERDLKPGHVWELNFNGKWEETWEGNRDYNFQISVKLR